MLNESDRSTASRNWRLPEEALSEFLNLDVQNSDLLDKYISKHLKAYGNLLLREFKLKAHSIQEKMRKILNDYYSGKQLDVTQMISIKEGLLLAHPSIQYVKGDYGESIHETGNITAGPYKHIGDLFLVGTMVFHYPETRLWYELVDVLLGKNHLVICQNCGAFTKRSRKDHKFCSSNCRKAYNAREKYESKKITTLS